MKILIIGYMHLKYDKRVFRTVEALSKNNKLIYQYRVDRYEEEYKQGNVTYKPILCTYDPKDSYLKEFIDRKTVDKIIIDMIKNYDYDILYMHHFLATAPIKAFKIAKKRNKKVIYDFHEHHPYNFMRHLSGYRKTLKLKMIWGIIKKQIFYSDKLIFVSEEIQNDILSTLEMDKEYLIVKNYASISFNSSFKNKEISVVGKTDRKFDNEKAILKKLVNKGFTFKIIGLDSDYFDDIPHLYTSFLPYNKMIKTLSYSAFSLISYSSFTGGENKNYTFSLPNKYFDSIAAGTPVIVKDTFVSMRKEIEKFGIGIVINPENINDSVNSILAAYENYDEILKNINKYKTLFMWNEKKENEFVNFVVS